MATGGHIVTLVGGKRPMTYIVGEPDREKALALLSQKLKRSVVPLPDPLPVSAETVRDHGIKSGQVKRLHL